MTSKSASTIGPHAGLSRQFLVDCGAWNPVGAGIAYNTAVHFRAHTNREFRCRARIATTNKVPNAPYRGAGRPEAALAMERTMDLIAAHAWPRAGRGQATQMIGPEEMPYQMGIPYRDGEPMVYDSGDYPGGLNTALGGVGGSLIPLAPTRGTRQGRHLGLGIACYVEGTGVGPFESATVRIEPRESSMSPRARARRDRAWRRSSPRSSPTPGRSSRRRRHRAGRYVGDRDRVRHVASRSTVTLSAAIFHASERLRTKCSPSRQNDGMRAGRPGAASRKSRHRRRPGEGGDAGRVSPRPRIPDGIMAGRMASTQDWRRAYY